MLNVKKKTLLSVSLLLFSLELFSQDSWLSLEGQVFQSPELKQVENIEQYNFDRELKEPYFERYRFYLLGSYGYAPGDTGIDEINRRAAERGIRTELSSVDDSRTGGEFGLGYWLTERFALELAYTNLGEVSVRGEGIQNQDIETFLDIIEEVHPDSGDGYSLSAKYNHPFSQRFSGFIRAGLFKWRGDYETRISDIQQRGSNRESNSDFFLGLGLKYRLSDRFDAFAEWRDYDFNDDDTHFWQLGLNFYFGQTHQPKVKTVDLAELPPPAAAPPVEPADTDGDGVIDDLDQCPGTPEGYKVDEVGCVIQQSVELLIEFPTDSAEVSRTYYQQIENVATVMNNHPDIQVEIEGHTDNTWKASYNLKLSQRRADAVTAILINEFNISPERIHSYGYGEDKPTATNDTDEGRQRNRRVMAKIVKQ
jgi:outer membrane protein OmpA-like peptidoglycan-associated protein